MRSKSLLIIGGSGFFGKTIFDYFQSYNSLKINKIIIFSRRARNIKIDKVLNSKKPEFVNVIIHPNQKIIPKLQFGKPIEDLSPLLPRLEFKKNMITPPLKENSLNFSEAN